MAWRIQSTVQATTSSDFTYDYYFTVLQVHLEIWLGIIGASLPTLAPIASKLVVPTFSRFVSSYRKLAAPSASRKNASRTIGGSGGDVPLQRTGFNRLEGGTLVGFGDVQHWGITGGTSKEVDFVTGLHEDKRSGRPDSITVRHEYDVFAEPRQQV
jgi:hypothetical protein